MAVFVEAHKNGTLPHEIHQSGENYGYIEKPTGAGKSWLVFDDLILRYEENIKREQPLKQVVNISCPILKLDEQFMNDLVSAIHGIYPDGGGFAFYLNSSDSGENYRCISSVKKDVNRIGDLERFLYDDHLHTAVVMSCHKSLPKFIDKVEELKRTYGCLEVISYIDEAHCIDPFRDRNEDDNMTFVDMSRLCEITDAVYLISATPDAKSIRFINTFNHLGRDSVKRIIRMTQSEAINQNLIVKPSFHVALTAGKNLECDMIASAMEFAKNDNPNIHHKMLVTMTESDALLKMAKHLEKKTGIKVFCTCAKYGMKEMDSPTAINDIVDFIHKVDNYDGDCFVMHIKQLIQGIDIKSLTDAVSFENDFSNPSGFKRYVQTNGRPQRTLSGERGMPIDKRTKKVCNIFYFLPNTDFGAVAFVKDFFIRVYGVGNMVFDCYRYTPDGFTEIEEIDPKNKSRLTNGSETTSIAKLRINIEDYIRTKMVNDLRIYNLIGKEIVINDEIDRVLEDCDAFGKSFTCNELLDNTELIKYITELFEKYEIDKYATAV